MFYITVKQLCQECTDEHRHKTRRVAVSRRLKTPAEHQMQALQRIISLTATANQLHLASLQHYTIANKGNGDVNGWYQELTLNSNMHRHTSRSVAGQRWLPTIRLSVRFSPGQSCIANLGKLFTPMCLSPSSTTVTAGLAKRMAAYKGENDLRHVWADCLLHWDQLQAQYGKTLHF